MNLHQELRLRLSHLSRREILLHMGYVKPNKSQFQRLDSVMKDPDLGMGESYYDFKYSSEAFVIKLSDIAGISSSLTRKEVTLIQERVIRQKQAFKPYLFVDTGFKRTTQPVFALAACEGQRYLHFDKDFWSVPLYEQLVTVYERIQEHMDQTKGFLGVWGYIRRYYFVYDYDGSAIEINPAGQIVAARDHFQTSVASVEVKGRNLMKAIGV